MWIGIDFGTYKSCGAFYAQDQYNLILNDRGERLTLNYVHISNDEWSMCGEHANSTVYSVKRPLCQDYDPSNKYQIWPESVELNDKNVGVRIFEGSPNNPQDCPVNGPNCYDPKDIISYMIYNLVENACSQLSSNIEGSVISVPDAFNQNQRKVIKEAGIRIGLKIRLINDSTAVMLAYQKRAPNYSGNILIYNLGATYVSASIVNFENGSPIIQKTVSDNVGADDFDYVLAENFIQKYNITNRRSIRRLVVECRRAKHELSVAQNTYIECECANSDGTMENITRSFFEDICNEIYNRCFDPVRKVIQREGITIDKIDRVVMVGGGSRINIIKRLMILMIKSEHKLDFTLNADEAVAIGSSINAAMLNGDSSVQDILPLNKTSHNITLVTKPGVTGLASQYIPILPSGTTWLGQESALIYMSKPFIPINIHEGDSIEGVKTGTIRIEEHSSTVKSKQIQVLIKTNIDIDGLISITAVDTISEQELLVTII